MKRLRPIGIWVFPAVGCAVVFGAGLAIGQGMGGGQRQSGSPPPIQQAPSTRPGYSTMGGMSPMSPMDPTATPDTLSGRIAEQQARSRNNERQKKLQEDTNKLLGLVTNFQQQVQEEKPLSPEDVSKRAEEIEKLARSVKDRMKG